MRAQPFISHAESIDTDYRIFYYSDVNTHNLYAHSHDFYELYLLVSGKVVYKTGGIDFFLRKGDMLFINKRQWHNPVSIEANVPYERIVVHVSPKALVELSAADTSIDMAECFSRDHFLVYHYPPEILTNIRLILSKLFSVAEGNVFGHKLLGRAYLTELFVEINQYNHNKKIYSFDKETKDAQIIELVKQYTLDHLHEEITIRMLADYLYMSTYHFMHVFKKNAGMSAYSFVLKIKLTAADEAIRNGLSFSEAGEQCGFGDYCNFYRAFHKEYGMSPRQYYSRSTPKPTQSKG